MLSLIVSENDEVPQQQQQPGGPDKQPVRFTRSIIDYRCHARRCRLNLQRRSHCVDDSIIVGLLLCTIHDGAFHRIQYKRAVPDAVLVRANVFLKEAVIRHAKLTVGVCR